MDCFASLAMTREELRNKSPPSFATAGRYRRAKTVRGRYATQRLQIRSNRKCLGDDLGGDAADAAAGQANGTGRARGEVEHASPDEGTAVVDGDDHRSAAMGDAQPGAERQGLVGG